MHISDCRCQDVDFCFFDELSRFNCSREPRTHVVRGVVDLGTAADVADLASTRISERMAFNVSTAVLVWRIFSSSGNLETSNTIESNPALAASMALARE